MMHVLSIIRDNRRALAIFAIALAVTALVLIVGFVVHADIGSFDLDALFISFYEWAESMAQAISSGA